MNIHSILYPVVAAAVSLAGVSCEKKVTPQFVLNETHVLEGGWLAADGSVFHFRRDGTFHGHDFRNREIWGNWVKLSDSRIGFQSLLHDSFYNPQYAIVDARDPDRMDFIVTGGTHFIGAKRIREADAKAAIRVVVDKTLHRP